MIKAILFDLDDTLLDIRLEYFLFHYISGQAHIFSDISGKSYPAAFGSLVNAYLTINNQKRTDGLTNRELFNATLGKSLEITPEDPMVMDALHCYDTEIVPSMNKKGFFESRPEPGANEAIQKIQDMGLTMALATNTLFSLEADMVRLGWAGIEDAPFVAISTIDTATRTKPSARYYQEFLGQIGFSAAECLMVGNDIQRDFPHPDIGLPTAYVGHANPRRAVFRGNLHQFAQELPRLVESLNAQESEN